MNKKLNITSVTYERLVNLGNFENERLSATVEISVNDSPEEAFEYLCQWVNEQLKSQERINRVEQKIQELSNQEKYLQVRVDKIKAQLESLQNQLVQISQHDIESDDIVF